jgi:hypothetical protein
MINAKQAREQSSDNFYKSLSADEKVAHFYVEDLIKLAIDKGHMFVEISYKNKDVPDETFKLLESQHYIDYLDELGFELRYDKVFGKYTIVW